MISPRPGVYCGSAGRRLQLVKFVKIAKINVMTNFLDTAFILKTPPSGVLSKVFPRENHSRPEDVDTSCSVVFRLRTKSIFLGKGLGYPRPAHHGVCMFKFHPAAGFRAFFVTVSNEIGNEGVNSRYKRRL